MKKALLVTTVSGFVPQFEMENVRLLQDMGYEVHYAANYHNVSYGTDNHRLDGTGIVRHQVDFVRSPYDIKGNLKAYRQLYEVVSEGGFDLIHCHTPMGGVLPRMVVRKLWKLGRRSNPPSIQEKRQMAQNIQDQSNRQVTTDEQENFAREAAVSAESTEASEKADVVVLPRVVYTAHGFHFFRGARLRNWLLYFPVEKWLSRYTDVQVTINREDYKRAKKYWHTNCKVVYVPGVGVDVSYYRGEDLANGEREQLRHSVREELGVKPDTILFLSVGELIPRKNHISVLQTLSRIGQLMMGNMAKSGQKLKETTQDNLQEGNHNIAKGKDEGDYKYIICGHGKLESEIRKQIRTLGLEGKVLLPGYCEDIRPYLYACDYFVFPSLQEGMPVALLEAVASGCRCIVSNIRGNRDIAMSVPELVDVYGNDCEFEQRLIRALLCGQAGQASENDENLKKYDREVVKEKMRRVYGEIDVGKA